MNENTSHEIASRFYKKEILKELPKTDLKRRPKRIVWFFVHAILIGLLIYCICIIDNLWINILLGVIIGNSFGTLGFLGHEILHGTVLKKRKWILFFGGICLVHWALPPQVWLNWHNAQHHNHTNEFFEDPDCFGPLEMYKRSKLVRFMEKLTPGSGTIRSYFFLFYWFTFHTFFQIYKNPKAFKVKKNRKWGLIYFFGVHILWAITTLSISRFIPLMLVPIIVSNSVMMAYVVTNHFISPATNDENDPLLNSLTVRSGKFIETMHLQNNFHVEHHVFPSINPSQAVKVRDILVKKWPDKYQEMNHFKAIYLVYKTPRLYKESTTLKNPRNDKEAHTLLHHYLDF